MILRASLNPKIGIYIYVYFPLGSPKIATFCRAWEARGPKIAIFCRAQGRRGHRAQGLFRLRVSLRLYLRRHSREEEAFRSHSAHQRATEYTTTGNPLIEVFTKNFDFFSHQINLKSVLKA